VLEPMPTPAVNGVSFNEFLVPARNNIQRELLRLQKLIGPPTKAGEEIPKYSRRDSMPYFYDLMVGIGFSLWRAVFQAAQAEEWNTHSERARIFLNEIIRNNAAVYATELNSWSLAYYLGNARFRLIELRRFFSKDNEIIELDEILKRFDASFSHVFDGPSHWVDCFHAMRLTLDYLEKH
jgi:hypothetical protein